MGGSRSGRYGGSPTAEGCASHILTTGFLQRCKIRHGQLLTAATTKDQSFQVAFTLDTRDPLNSFIDVEHEPYTDDEGTVRYRLQLATTRPPFGGLRWWFICPSTGRRVSKLFLPRGGRRFLSRQAYGLGYACQRLAPTDRIHLQGRKLYRALGGEGDWQDEYPEKPKGMRWHTYNRKIDQLEALSEKLEALWTPRMAILLQRFEPQQ